MMMERICYGYEQCMPQIGNMDTLWENTAQVRYSTS